MILCSWGFSLLYGCVHYILENPGQIVLEVLPQGNIYIYFKRPPCRRKCRIFFKTFNRFVRNILYQTTTILGSDCFCLVQRKLKASLCAAETAGGRTQGTAFTHPHAQTRVQLSQNIYFAENREEQPCIPTVLRKTYR